MQVTYNYILETFDVFFKQKEIINCSIINIFCKYTPRNERPHRNNYVSYSLWYWKLTHYFPYGSLKQYFPVLIRVWANMDYNYLAIKLAASPVLGMKPGSLALVITWISTAGITLRQTLKNEFISSNAFRNSMKYRTYNILQKRHSNKPFKFSITMHRRQ